MADVHGIAGQIGRIREKANALVEQELKDRGINGIVPAHGAVLSFLLQQKGPVAIKAVVENVRRVKSTVTVMIGRPWFSATQGTRNEVSRPPE